MRKDEAKAETSETPIIPFYAEITPVTCTIGSAPRFSRNRQLKLASSHKSNYAKGIPRLHIFKNACSMRYWAWELLLTLSGQATRISKVSARLGSPNHLGSALNGSCNSYNAAQQPESCRPTVINQITITVKSHSCFLPSYETHQTCCKTIESTSPSTIQENERLQRILKDTNA